MIRFGTAVAFVDILAGLVTLFGVYAGYLGSLTCPLLLVPTGAVFRCGSILWGDKGVEVASAVLALGSLSSFVGPRKIFYVPGTLSGVTFFLLLLDSSLTAPVMICLGLLASALVVSVLAARREPSVSEQSHPMNLPVFG